MPVSWSSANGSSTNIAGDTLHWYQLRSVSFSYQVSSVSGNSFAQPPTMPASYRIAVPAVTRGC
jgi:hypothetical protein